MKAFLKFSIYFINISNKNSFRLYRLSQKGLYAICKRALPTNHLLCVCHVNYTIIGNSFERAVKYSEQSTVCECK